MLLHEGEELISWSHVGVELLGFLGSYALYGAVGARAVAPRLVGASNAAKRNVGAGAALIGAAGALTSLSTMVLGAAQRAAEHGTTVAAAMAQGGSRFAVQGGLLALALVGLLLASRRVSAGWYAAFVATAGLALRNLMTGKWAALVNPLHVLAGGLWLGTLAVLVVVLFPVLLRGDAGGHDLGVRPGGSRLDALVRRFSRLALLSSALLFVTGVITSWRHLGSVDALWTTPYGWALDAKLAIVGGIAAFGYYNWKVATPRLSAGTGDARLVQSSRREVLLGLMVLLVTAVLVSLPAPAEEKAEKGKGHEGPPPAAPGPPPSAARPVTPSAG